MTRNCTLDETEEERNHRLQVRRLGILRNDHTLLQNKLKNSTAEEANEIRNKLPRLMKKINVIDGQVQQLKKKMQQPLKKTQLKKKSQQKEILGIDKKTSADRREKALLSEKRKALDKGWKKVAEKEKELAENELIEKELAEMEVANREAEKKREREKWISKNNLVLMNKSTLDELDKLISALHIHNHCQCMKDTSVVRESMLYDGRKHSVVTVYSTLSNLLK
ncbi:hypothetical protein BDB01DRAFT_294187 [Pilobolus umbonatus]|nr:hypothetical protein BDB01DRAFT_294187 [Pilobolus umbonatus]